MVISLCYMAKLSLRKGGYPQWAWTQASALKEWELFWEKEIRDTIFNMYDALHWWLEDEEMAGGLQKLITSPHNTQEDDENLNPKTVMNWSLPPGEWAWKRTLTQSFPIGTLPTQYVECETLSREARWAHLDFWLIELWNNGCGFKPLSLW